MVSIKFSKKLVIAFKPKIPVEIFCGSSSPAFATTPTKSPSACTIGGIALIAATAFFEVFCKLSAVETNIGMNPLRPGAPSIIKPKLYIEIETKVSIGISGVPNVAAFATTSIILSIASMIGIIASVTTTNVFAPQYPN